MQQTEFRLLDCFFFNHRMMGIFWCFCVFLEDQIFLLYFGKGNFGGKKFYFAKVWIYFAKKVIRLFIEWIHGIRNFMGRYNKYKYLGSNFSIFYGSFGQKPPAMKKTTDQSLYFLAIPHSHLWRNNPWPRIRALKISCH